MLRACWASAQRRRVRGFPVHAPDSRTICMSHDPCCSDRKVSPMPSELSPRDAELRRMLVAAADAAPLQRRRPRALVLLTVFAISGALSGAAVSAAAALTAEPPTQGSVVS